MTYYKFLSQGGLAPFTRRRWSSEWMEVADPSACMRGLHACRLDDLPYWLHDELWRVDLDGPVQATGRKVVVGRARLSSRVLGWDGDSAGDLAVACTGRIAQHAARECGDLDDGALAALGAELTAVSADRGERRWSGCGR